MNFHTGYCENPRRQTGIKRINRDEQDEDEKTMKTMKAGSRTNKKKGEKIGKCT
jgi:hypothetical protein